MPRLGFTKPEVTTFFEGKISITRLKGSIQPVVGEVILKGKVFDEESQIFRAGLGDSEAHIKNTFIPDFTLDVYLLKYKMLVTRGTMLRCSTRVDGWLGGEIREKKRYKTTIIGSHSKQIARAIGIHIIMVTVIEVGLLTVEHYAMHTCTSATVD